jgi:4-hydroxyphenylpyruvate dioxygenase
MEAVIGERTCSGEGFGIVRVDHAVGNVWSLAPDVAKIKKFTGFHEFAEFTAEVPSISP